MRIFDNNLGVDISSGYSEFSIKELQEYIANKSIDDLIKNNPDLLVFPSFIGWHDDDIGKKCICALDNSILTTYNVMGFIGVNDTQLAISSRFSQDENDYFLHYLLQKVFSLNIFNLKHERDKESIWDFLLYLFPYYLKKALNQGIYKEYTHRRYNNANVKGAIDISRHIRTNRPFLGNIAYSTREHSFDNIITELIRHTIEYINTDSLGNYILFSDYATSSFVNHIEYITPGYNKNDRQYIIKENAKPFRHPFFYEYRDLQKLCLSILRKEKYTYGKDKNKVHGILFDGAWLWEEYLNKILEKENYIHSENITGKNPIYLFHNNKSKYRRYPDFIKDNIVLDAKYKHLDLVSELDRNDIHQIITYMYVQSAPIGGFIYPKSGSVVSAEKLGVLNGYSGVIFRIPFNIPQNDSYSSFINSMKLNEEHLIDVIKGLN